MGGKSKYRSLKRSSPAVRGIWDTTECARASLCDYNESLKGEIECNVVSLMECSISSSA